LKIYTRTGDQGTTANVLGQRISKGDPMLVLQGTIDEINANVGYLRALLKGMSMKKEPVFDLDVKLRDIQYALFKIGADISSGFSYEYIKEDEITEMEHGIDVMTDAVGPLSNFIYYSGNPASTYCHVIRSVVRRAERIFVRYLEDKEYNLDYQYINRLSDYFFTLARYTNFLTGTEEEAMQLR
jgi:cob(I)alamin adenosyltransferase